MAAALTLPTMAFAADPAMMKDGMMTDHKGMTLYTFDKDTGWQVGVQRQVRGKLAAADGAGG